MSHESKMWYVVDNPKIPFVHLPGQLKSKAIMYDCVHPHWCNVDKSTKKLFSPAIASLSFESLFDTC